MHTRIRFYGEIKHAFKKELGPYVNKYGALQST